MHTIDEIKDDAKALVAEARRSMGRVAHLADPKNANESSPEKLTAALIELAFHVGQLAGLVNFLADKLDE